MEDNRSTAFSLSRRIGSTNYRVKVFFSETETETLEDKIYRMIQNEISETCFECDPAQLPQMSLPA